jgi:hypothetical protein
MIIHVFLYWNWKEKKVEQCSPTITWTSTKRTTHNSSNKSNHLYDQWSSRSGLEQACIMKHKTKYTETEQNEMKRNEIYQNETKQNET